MRQMDELKKLRNDLDMCDEILIDALRMRCQIIQEITNYKQKNGLPIYQAEEEERKKSKMLAKLDDYEYKNQSWQFTTASSTGANGFSPMSCLGSIFS